VRPGLIGCAFVVFALASCGSSPTPEAQIRHSFQRLLAAAHDHDAHTVCELLFPFGQHQPAAALAAALRKLETEPGRGQYQASIDRCAPVLANEPKTFVTYSRGLAGISLRGLTVHGNQATVAVPPKPGRSNTITFVRAAGEWRLRIGVQ
jgi:hypothetical protein